MYTTSKGPLTGQECNIFGRIPSVCQKKGHKICKSSMRVAIFMKIIGALAKRALRARARYLNVNLARRNRDLQPGGTEIESLEEKSDSL